MSSHRVCAAPRVLAAAVASTTMLLASDPAVAGFETVQTAAEQRPRISSGWLIEEQVIEADNIADDALFGASVDISDDVLAVGCPYEDQPDLAAAGAVYLYEYDDGVAPNWQLIDHVAGLTADSGFGTSVGVDRLSMLVGAPSDNDGAGGAYMFARQAWLSDDWALLHDLPLSEEHERGDWFGMSVAIDAATAAVGIPYDGTDGFDTGAVQVLVRPVGEPFARWNAEQQVRSSDTAVNTAFGTAVALDGDTLVVGAAEEEIPGHGPSGAAYVFERSRGSSPQWLLRARLVASDPSADDRFGAAVAIDGDTIVIGAPMHNRVSSAPRAATGAAYVFERVADSASAWVEAAILEPNRQAPFDMAGSAVSIHDDLIVVGSPGANVCQLNNAGAAHVFEREKLSASRWQQTRKLIASAPTEEEFFGTSVAVDGARVVIGAPRRDVEDRMDAGAVYVFTAGARRLLGGRSGIQIQNSVSDRNNNAVMYFDQVGGGMMTESVLYFGHGGAKNVYFPSESQESVPDGIYTARILSSKPIAAVARTDWPTGGAALYSNPTADTNIIVPLGLKRFHGQSSQIAVQNPAINEVVEASVALIPRGVSEPTKVVTLALEAGASDIMDFATDWRFSDVEEGFIGSVRVRSLAEVAVQSYVYFENSAAVSAFEGVPYSEAAQRVHVPLFRNDYYGTTGISVANVTSSEIEVTVTFDGTLGDCNNDIVYKQHAPLEANSSVVFWQGDTNTHTTPERLPKNCAGTAVVDASPGGRIVAVVNDSVGLDPPSVSSAYNAVPIEQASTEIALPLWRRKHTDHGLTTGIHVMNPSMAPGEVANVELILEGSTGARIDIGDEGRVAVKPGSAHTWYPPALTNLVDGTYGSGRVVSDRPVVAVVNDAATIGYSDSATYLGIAIPGGTSKHVSLPVLEVFR